MRSADVASVRRLVGHTVRKAPPLDSWALFPKSSRTAAHRNDPDMMTSFDILTSDLYLDVPLSSHVAMVTLLPTQSDLLRTAGRVPQLSSARFCDVQRSWRAVREKQTAQVSVVVAMQEENLPHQWVRDECTALATLLSSVLYTFRT